MLRGKRNVERKEEGREGKRNVERERGVLRGKKNIGNYGKILITQ